MSLAVAFRHAFPGLAFEIAFEAPTPGTTVLFGPSGSGKSTIVAVVAGLLRPPFCRVVIDAEVLADTSRGAFEPPERRRIGVVFQDARLFPHLSVRRNLTYGLRRAIRRNKEATSGAAATPPSPVSGPYARARWEPLSPRERGERGPKGALAKEPSPPPLAGERCRGGGAPRGRLIEGRPAGSWWGTRDDERSSSAAIALSDVVDLLGIGHLLERRPHTLSGGERQRVAIGRALLAQPRLLVMDEPLASLDAARKDEILPYLLRLKTTLSLPILYVTHALEEVARLADTLVLIEAGTVLAAGPLAEIAVRGDLPLASRDDAGAILHMRIAAHDPAAQLSLLEAYGIALQVPLLHAPVGSALRARVPAREVILATDAPQAISVHNVIEGRVRAITQDPARHAALVEVASGNSVLLARVTPDAVARLRLAPGVRVLALVKSMAVEVLAAAS